MATKTGQTGYDHSIMLHAATTFEECTKCHHCEGQQTWEKYLLKTALRESLKENYVQTKELILTQPPFSSTIHVCLYY